MALFEAALLLHAIAHARGRQAVRGSLAAELSDLRDDQRREHALRMSRARWLEENDAEGSWPCGVVRYAGGEPADLPPPPGHDPWARATRPGQDELPVTTVQLPADIAFLAEPPEDTGLEEMLEVGRIPRSALGDVDVLDRNGWHVPEPATEAMEPPSECELVLRWTNAGVPDEDRFRFRSTWLAWAAGRRLRQARLP